MKQATALRPFHPRSSARVLANILPSWPGLHCIRGAVPDSQINALNALTGFGNIRSMCLQALALLPPLLGRGRPYCCSPDACQA